VETVVEHVVEKQVVQTIEQPVIKRVYRIRYVQNPQQLWTVGILAFLAGLVMGQFL
jgi:hypothetical protein